MKNIQFYCEMNYDIHFHICYCLSERVRVSSENLAKAKLDNMVESVKYWTKEYEIADMIFVEFRKNCKITH